MQASAEWGTDSARAASHGYLDVCEGLLVTLPRAPPPFSPDVSAPFTCPPPRPPPCVCCLHLSSPLEVAHTAGWMCPCVNGVPTNPWRMFKRLSWAPPSEYSCAPSSWTDSQPSADTRNFSDLTSTFITAPPPGAIEAFFLACLCLSTSWSKRSSSIHLDISPKRLCSTVSWSVHSLLRHVGGQFKGKQNSANRLSTFSGRISLKKEIDFDGISSMSLCAPEDGSLETEVTSAWTERS